MKEIKLTQGKTAFVDDEDFERLNQFRWCAHFDGYNWYATRRNKKKCIYMHREIMKATRGSRIDHCNGNSLDNREENLRFCTHQQNTYNRRHPHKNNKLGIKGVHWDKWENKFRARIQFNGKVIHLGYFNVMGDADSAYRKAEEKYFGEFARKE